MFLYGISAVEYFEIRPLAAYDLSAASNSKQIIRLVVTVFIYNRNRQTNFFEENVSQRSPICELLILHVKLPRTSPLRFLKGRKADTRTVYEEMVGFTLQLLLLPGGSSPARG